MALTPEQMRAIREDMGKYGVNPDEVVMIFFPKDDETEQECLGRYLKMFERQEG